MNKFFNYLVAFAMPSILMVVILNSPAFGQAEKADKSKIVGIDPQNNIVRLPNTPENPLSVKVENTPVRKPFQTRIIVTPAGIGNSSALLPIPAGKRLVIEHVSAIARCPAGLKMEINFSSYFDNDGNGVGGVEDITFHRIALIDQGVFGDTFIATASQKMLVFADERIGTASYGVSVQARLSAMPPAGSGTIQAQLTFTGYLEDLPAV